MQTRLLFSVFLSCFIFNNLHGQSICKRWTALNSKIHEKHYRPKPVNDQMSQAVYDLLMERLNDQGFHFLAEDQEAFKENRSKLDDYFSSGACDFLDIYVTTYEKRIQESKDIVSGLKDVHLDYRKNDTLFSSRKHLIHFFKNQADKTNYWRKIVKYKTLVKFIENQADEGQVDNLFLLKEKDYRHDVIQTLLCQMDEVSLAKNGVRKLVEYSLLNAYTSYQDPHSAFLDSQDKSSYESQLSVVEKSTGIHTFKNEDGEIEVGHITPGSSAFKNRRVDEGDVVTAIVIEGQITDLSCFSNRELQKLLNDPAVSEITFNIQKDSGLSEAVQLPKTFIEVEENNLKGFIIKGTKSIGYISVPSFYTDYESPNGLGVASDLARELYKLEKIGIEGLIIDLRDNGGGSLKEAMDLSGLFIDVGPLSILEDNTGNTETLRDFNRGVAFKRPVAVLVNENSASASEFFAAALQDYNRAIIIGSPTYGKSTAQVILPLDEDEHLGFVKLTTEAFYRATGKSHQAKGVIPDVELPSIYHNLKIRENSEGYALPNKEIPITLRTRPLSTINTDKLASQSAHRIAQNSAFQNIQHKNIQLQRIFDEGSFMLIQLDGVKKYLAQQDAFYEDYDRDPNEHLVIENTTSTIQINDLDHTAKKINQRIIADLQSDPYILEASLVLTDYLNGK